jgi:hypothetical protein
LLPFKRSRPLLVKASSTGDASSSALGVQGKGVFSLRRLFIGLARTIHL